MDVAEGAPDFYGAEVEGGTAPPLPPLAVGGSFGVGID
jgi:hypothetical protein